MAAVVEGLGGPDPTAPAVYVGPCPTCQQHIWQPVRCSCGHMLSAHTPNASGLRKACTSTDQSGPCSCKTFIAEVPDGV